MALGIMQNDGSNITGFSSAVQPDKSLTRSNNPRTFTVQFGDGYEQRIQEGINNISHTFSVSFNNRPKADIDDIIAFFINKGGTTAFSFTYPDSNVGGGEKTVKVVCEDFNQTYSYDDFYSCTASFRRVYEA